MSGGPGKRLDGLRLGVLSLQGAFREHILILQQLQSRAQSFQAGSQAGVEGIPRIVSVTEIRSPEQLRPASEPGLPLDRAAFPIDALILPGGESTTMAILAEKNGLLDELRAWVHVHKKPVWGTCAGLILLSRTVNHAKQGGQSLIGGLDVDVDRNAFGRQLDSFSAPLDVGALFPGDHGTPAPFPGIFIRAPIIEKLHSPDVQVLLQVVRPSTHEPVIVGVRQGLLFGTAFHPELTADTRIHEYFLRVVAASCAL